MFLSNTSCLFVDVEMSFKIWDTIYPLVNTCKQMNIQNFFICPVIILGGCFFVLFFVPFAVGRSWMPDKHGCVGLSDSYKVREVGWCQNIEIFLIVVLLIIYSLLLLFQTFCWLASPTPQPLDSWPRVLTFELWHDDMWYVQLLFILASLEYLFVLPKLHLLQMWTEFLKIYFLLWPFIDFFLYLPLLISTYIHICTCMC